MSGDSEKEKEKEKEAVAAQSVNEVNETKDYSDTGVFTKIGGSSEVAVDGKRINQGSAGIEASYDIGKLI